MGAETATATTPVKPPTSGHTARDTVIGALMAIASGACMGLYLPLQKSIMAQGVSPAGLNWLQALVMAGFLLPAYLMSQRGRRWPRRIPVLWLLVFGLTASELFYSRNAGLQLTGPTTGGVILASEVLFSFVLSLIFFRHRVSVAAVCGGVVLLIGAGLTTRVSLAQLRFPPLGVVLLLLCAFSIAVNAVIIKARLNRLPSIFIALCNASIQFLVWGAALSATGRIPPARSLADGMLVLKIALGAVLMASNLVTYYYAMKRCPMWVVRTLQLVAPAVAMTGDHFYLGTPILTGQVAGLIVATAGAALMVQDCRAGGDEC